MLIAIAESAETDTEFLEGHLRRWGFETEALSNGASVVKRVQEASPPRVLLMSWTLHGPQAAEVCRRIRALEDVACPHIVLLVTRSEFHDALAAVEEGLADDCLLRPLDAYGLEARLALARKSLALRSRLTRTENELKAQSLKDGLTGLWNRDACLTFLRRELLGSCRTGSPVGAVLLNLPGLEAIDHELGFEAGANALRVVAETLRTAVRTTDWSGRFSERQFLVVLPSCGEARVRSVGARLAQVVWDGLVAAKTPTSRSEVLATTAVAAHCETNVDEFLAQLRG